MKRSFIVVAAALLIASCSSESGKRQTRLTKRVVKEISVLSTGVVVPFDEKQIKYVDNMFEVGDTIKLVSQYYVIVK